jgi:hypothetical protein
MEVLQQAKALGSGRLIFPGRSTNPLGENSFGECLRRGAGAW